MTGNPVPPSPDRPTKPTKAIGAAVGTLLSTLALALEDGKITGDETASIIGATVGVALIVYGLHNRPK